MIIGIVLAAGGSTRMGRSKALLDLDGRPLVRAADGRTPELVLPPGIHHLRVDYQNREDAAHVRLTAATRSDQPLPRLEAVLRYPGDTLVEAHPCGEGTGR